MPIRRHFRPGSSKQKTKTHLERVQLRDRVHFGALFIVAEHVFGVALKAKHPTPLPFFVLLVHLFIKTTWAFMPSNTPAVNGLDWNPPGAPSRLLGRRPAAMGCDSSTTHAHDISRRFREILMFRFRHSILSNDSRNMNIPYNSTCVSPPCTSAGP